MYNTGTKMMFCPKCGRQSEQMTMSQTKKHNPTDMQLNSHFSNIATEILECPCGHEMSWFDGFWTCFLGVSHELNQWLKNSERSEPAMAIVEVTTGINFSEEEHERMPSPLDPGEFRDCQKLLEMVPDVKSKFFMMQQVSIQWEILYKMWDYLLTRNPDALAEILLEIDSNPRQGILAGLVEEFGK